MRCIVHWQIMATRLSCCPTSRLCATTFGCSMSCTMTLALYSYCSRVLVIKYDGILRCICSPFTLVPILHRMLLHASVESAPSTNYFSSGVQPGSLTNSSGKSIPTLLALNRTLSSSLMCLSSRASILIRGSAVEVSMGRTASGVLCGWGWWLVG
jgi:hypothetical protein